VPSLLAAWDERRQPHRAAGAGRTVSCVADCRAGVESRPIVRVHRNDELAGVAADVPDAAGPECRNAWNAEADGPSLKRLVAPDRRRVLTDAPAPHPDVACDSISDDASLMGSPALDSTTINVRVRRPWRESHAKRITRPSRPRGMDEDDRSVAGKDGNRFARARAFGYGVLQ
jgi:hypothetical protein